MKKILVVGLCNSLGGMESFFNNYYEYLYKNYFFDFVTCDSDIYYGNKYRGDGSNVYSLPSFKKHPFEYAKELKKILNNGNYDYIYINMLSAANIIPIKVAKNYNIKIITHSHSSNMKGHAIKKILHFVNRKQIIKNADVCLACSEKAGKWLYKNRLFLVINNAIDVNKYEYNEKERKKIRKKIKVDSSKFLIGNVARFSDEKNHIFMIKIMKKLVEIDQDIILLLIGNGSNYTSINNEVIKNKLENNVIFTGTINDVNLYYNAMDLFILPSLFEGLSLVAIEAQTNGLKCFFSTNVNRDTDISGKSVFLGIDESNLDDWISEILKEKNKIDKNRKTLLNTEFNIENNAKLLDDVFKNNK